MNHDQDAAAIETDLPSDILMVGCHDDAEDGQAASSLHSILGATRRLDDPSYLIHDATPRLDIDAILRGSVGPRPEMRIVNVGRMAAAMGCAMMQMSERADHFHDALVEEDRRKPEWQKRRDASARAKAALVERMRTKRT